MEHKIVSEEQLKQKLEKLKADGKKISFTSGAFDLLHQAHIRIIQEAKKLGDVLVVGLNSDSSIRAYKSPLRPLYNENDRAFMVAALEAVDFVVVFYEDDPTPILERIKPDFFVRGGKSIPERLQKSREALAKWGGQVVELPTIEGYSSSSVIDKILKHFTGKGEPKFEGAVSKEVAK